ncbi:RICIN domain-containing protein [Streptomyces sp. NPDC050803]|uniref:RICIN domain-containing protein n=1 Tax=unclassified Streptomyces TaxID=2593676 RepID=UPI00342E60B8
MNVRRSLTIPYRKAAAALVAALVCAPVLTGSSLTGSIPTAAAAEPVVNARLFNQGTGFCLANPSSSPDNGTVMFQWSCSYSDSNYWSLKPMTGGGYHVVNKASGKCLAIAGGNPDPGVKAIQWGCGTEQLDEQVWLHDGTERLKNAETGLCLAIPNTSPTVGTQAVQWTCGTNKDQQWLW